MKLNSQICTTVEQSERLLGLGLKKETADCCYYYYDGQYLIAFAEDAEYPSDIPAWSLHRLLSMLTAKRKVLLIRFEADLYDVLIDRIENEIKEGNFNKEYLEE